MMKKDRLGELDSTELFRRLEGLKEELFNIRVKAHLERIDKPHKIRLIKRDIARIETVLSMRKRGA